MCCGIIGQGVQKALSLDLNPYDGEKPHLIVVRFILRRGQTNVQIEISEFDGGVRATGLLCLLGAGIGLSTFLVYKLCSKLHFRFFTSSSVDKTKLHFPHISVLPNTQIPDSGISLGIKKIKNPGILHRSQVVKPQEFPQIWRKRIIDWLAKSTFPFDGEGSSSDDDEDEFDEEDEKVTCKAKKAKLDAMLASTRSGWSSGFISILDDMDPNSFNYNNDSFGVIKGELMGGANDEIDEEEKEFLVCDEPLSNLELDSKLEQSQTIKKLSGTHRRPKSGNSSSSMSSDAQLHFDRGMQRNCYSHKSGDSSLYDYRESLVSKGFSVDLGENLEGVVVTDAHNLTLCDLLSNEGPDQGVVNHMDWMQYELTKIQLDIDCLNQKFDDLCQPKSDLSSEHQIPEGFLNKKSHHEESRSASVESIDPILPSHPGTPDEFETIDFIWDYHSDLASVSQPTFVSARPLTDRSSYTKSRKYEVSRDVVDDESDEEDDGNNFMEDTNGLVQEKSRRESIILFYFDDDLNDDFIGDLERSQSVADISAKKQNNFSCKQFLISRSNKVECSSLKELQGATSTNSLIAPIEKNIINRRLQPVSPRNLRKPKFEPSKEASNIENNTWSRDRIFSCEEKRIVGDEKKLFEHLEIDLHVDVMQISDIRKGYSKIFDMWGPSSVRSFRSERFSILGPITFQVLLHGLPILSDIGGNFQNSVQYLVAAIDNGHQYLMDWKYRGFLWAPKNEVLFKLINSLRIFCEQVTTAMGMSNKKCREQYLVSLINHSTDIEVHLVEALKIVIMLKVISLSKNSADFLLRFEEWFGPSYSTAELIFRNLVNVVEDGTLLDDVQLSILSTTLSTQIEILRPSQWGSEGFIQTYPTVGGDNSSGWKMSIIEDEPTFLYCLPAIVGN